MSLRNKEFVPRQMRKIGVTRRSVSGFFPFRGTKSIEYESSLERDFLIRNEFSLRVRDIVPQPVRIPYVSSDGRTYRYTPDFWVCFEDATPPALIEVKPRDEWLASWRLWLPKWKAAWRYAQEQGWQFHIHDESRIRDTAFENIRFLLRCRGTYFAPDDVQAVLQSASRLGPVSIQALLTHSGKALNSATDGVALTHHLLATRQLDCDTGRPLSASSLVWRAGHGR